MKWIWPTLGDLKVFKVGPRPKNTIFGPVPSTILAVLKETENLAYVFIPNGETNKTSNYQKRESNKISDIISWFVMEMCFNAKTHFIEKKWEFVYFSLLAYFL